jgi:hypothetical protein
MNIFKIVDEFSTAGRKDACQLKAEHFCIRMRGVGYQDN